MLTVNSSNSFKYKTAEVKKSTCLHLRDNYFDSWTRSYKSLLYLHIQKQMHAVMQWAELSGSDSKAPLCAGWTTIWLECPAGVVMPKLSFPWVWPFSHHTGAPARLAPPSPQAPGRSRLQTNPPHSSPSVQMARTSNLGLRPLTRLLLLLLYLKLGLAAPRAAAGRPRLQCSTGLRTPVCGSAEGELGAASPPPVAFCVQLCFSPLEPIP